MIFVTDVSSSRARGGGHLHAGVSPCLTRRRCEDGGHWLINMNRRMTLVEMERLQGIPDGRLRIPTQVPARSYRGMLGNAFTVSVVGRVALRLLRAVGIRCPGDTDPWAAGG